MRVRSVFPANLLDGDTDLPFTITKNGLAYVDLPVLDATRARIDYTIPDWIPKVRFVAQFAETGCYPVANIWCSPKGRPLKAYYYTSRDGGIPCGEHALFTTRGKFVSITARWEEQRVTIAEYTLAAPIGQTITLYVSTVYNGPADLNTLPQYATAINAAMLKANCYECTKPFFYKP